ncbi:MAG: polysaccharide biosynthesis C-terminal domain-containing protein [Candidatus Micrarchaeota archaeon]
MRLGIGGLFGLLDDRPFFKNNVIASAGTLVTLFLAYLFHFVVTRILPQSEYGDLSVLVGVFSVVSIPAASVSAVLTRELSKLEAAGRQKELNYVLKKYLKNTIMLSSLLFVGVAVAGLFVYKSWQLQLGLAIIALGIPAAYYTNLATSYFQAKEKITVLMLIGIAREACKLAAAVLLVTAGWGLAGGAASFPIGFFAVAIAIAFYFSKRLAGGVRHEISLRRSFFLMMAASVLYSAFMYLDLFFVKALTGSVYAGIYNVASVTGKMLFYMSTGMVLVTFPKSSKLSYAKHPEVIRQVVVKTAALLLPLLAVFVLLPGQILSIFYPPEYAPAAPVLSLLAVGVFFYAVFIILMNVMWSQNQEVFPLVLLAGALAVHAGLLSLLIPRMQLQGAALATVLSSFLLASAAAAHVWKSTRAKTQPAG